MVGLLKLLLDGFLPLTAVEVEEWRDDPEGYYLEQESLEARESVRVRSVLDIKEGGGAGEGGRGCGSRMRGGWQDKEGRGGRAGGGWKELRERG